LSVSVALFPRLLLYSIFVNQRAFACGMFNTFGDCAS